MHNGGKGGKLRDAAYVHSAWWGRSYVASFLSWNCPHFIYQSLAQREIASFLRREGFSDGSRKMKLFTFSRLIGNYSLNLEHKTITFSKDIALVFASPVELIVWELTESLLKSSCIWIGGCALQVGDVFFEDSFQGSDELEVIIFHP